MPEAYYSTIRRAQLGRQYARRLLIGEVYPRLRD